jgi:uroporphyrinogen decarboxylase
MTEMSKWERVRAALAHAEVDRIPISLWKHYHLQDRAPGQLAEVTYSFYQQFDLDLIKLTPSGLYPIMDWGATVKFGTDDDTFPLPIEPVITSAEEWATLPGLDVKKGVLRRELETIRHLAAILRGEAPFMMTIFSPLNIAFKLCGEKAAGMGLLEHMRRHPQQLHSGLATIGEVVKDYAAACLEAGAPGIFFATQMATSDMMTPSEFSEFGRAYDLPVLESLADKSEITMLHVCGQNLFFDLVADYSVDAINWAAHTSGTTLAMARQMTDRPLAGGLSLDTLLNGAEEEAWNEARAAIEEGGRTGFLLAPDCVVRGASPDTNLAAARRAASEIG